MYKIYRFQLKVYPPSFYPPVVWRTGGQFSLKVGVIKRNENQSLSVTSMEHDIPNVIPTTKGRD